MLMSCACQHLVRCNKITYYDEMNTHIYIYIFVISHGLHTAWWSSEICYTYLNVCMEKRLDGERRRGGGEGGEGGGGSG